MDGCAEETRSTHQVSMEETPLMAAVMDRDLNEVKRLAKLQ